MRKDIDGTRESKIVQRVPMNKKFAKHRPDGRGVDVPALTQVAIYLPPMQHLTLCACKNAAMGYANSLHQKRVE